MNKSKYNSIIFLAGMIIGLIVFVTIYGTTILNVTYDKLIVDGYIEKDIAQHYTGWILYRNSPWQFPLGVGQNMAYPYGSSVSYTDSIPLFAIFFKLFRNILPATFQYFGIFVLLCFMLQGGFAAILSRLFNENIFVNLLVAALFSFTPIMIERAFRHCALTAHFLILAALYYYFKNKGQTGFKSVLPFFIINALAITIHPYFLPFTFGIMFAFSVENFFLKKKYVSSPLYVVRSIVVTLFIGYTIGAFYVGGSMSSIGYGLYNMNLNALFNPISQGFNNWSTVLEIKPNFSYTVDNVIYWGQIEAFNYVGLGFLLFIPVSFVIFLVSRRKTIFKDIFSFIKAYFGIIFSTAALLIFALGDWITYGGLRIFRLPIPEFLINGLFGVFRANGRFGWLLVYMIMGFVVYIIISGKNKKLSVVLLAIMLSVQAIDLNDVITSKRGYFTGKDNFTQHQQADKIIKSQFWTDAAKQADAVYRTYEPVSNSCIEIAQKFALEGRKTNTAFEARVNHEKFSQQAEKLIADIKAGALEDDVIVLFAENDEELFNTAYKNGYHIYFEDNTYIITSLDIGGYEKLSL